MINSNEWDVEVKSHWTMAVYPYLWFLSYFGALLNLVPILGLMPSDLPLVIHIISFSVGFIGGTVLLIVRIIELK